MKNIRRFFIFAIVLVGLVCMIPSSSVKATSITITMVDGAQVRTEGVQGLRFEASSSDVAGIEHGFYLVSGKQDSNALKNAISNGETTINSKKIVKVNTSGDSTTFAVTITGIEPTNYDKEITVVAYAKEESTYTFSNVVVTRNVYDTARGYFNENKTNAERNTDITSIVENNARVKVVNGENTNYYASFTNFLKSPGIKEGDQISLVSLSYTGSLTISANNVSISGAQDNPTNKSSAERGNETIFTKTITVAAGTQNIKLSGLSIKGETGVKLSGSTDGLTITNNMFSHSGTCAINDTGNSNTHSNITITGNTFNGANTEYQKIVYIYGTTSQYEISNNLFIDKASSITLENKGTEEEPSYSPNSYAIKINKIADFGTVNIQDNEFNCYGTDWVIDVNSNNSSKSTISVNIENNKMSSSYTKSLQGNGIRVSYLNTNSFVKIIHNTSFKTSVYYNAILISNEIAPVPSSPLDVTIDIKYNQFYADAKSEVAKPDGRKENTSKLSRIGLGVSTTSTVNIEYNYYAYSSSTYVYKSYTLSTATKANNTTSLTTNEVTSTILEEAGYSTSTEYLNALYAEYVASK